MAPDTKRKLYPRKKDVFVIEKSVEDVKQEEKDVPHLLESIMRPTDPVKETPVGSTTAVAVILVPDPIENVADTPVNETVSSARFPHSPSFHAFAPHPVASKASRFQYAWPQVNRPHPEETDIVVLLC